MTSVCAICLLELDESLFRILSCGHSFHNDCLLKLHFQSHDVPDPVYFVPLPWMPRFLCNVKQCPTCRQDVLPCQPSYNEQFFENSMNCKTIGPYKLYPGSIMWMYNQRHQTGHPQAGTLGILLKYHETTKHLVVVKDIIDEQTEYIVPTAYIFDIAFLQYMHGIPNRTAFSHFYDIAGQYVCANNICPKYVLKNALSIRDFKLASDINQRINYIQHVITHSNTIKSKLQHYLLQGQLSDLHPVRPVINIDDFWHYKLMPRLGFQALLKIPLIPRTLSAFPIQWKTIEDLAVKSRTVLPVCYYTYLYEQAGYLCNDNTTKFDEENIANVLKKQVCVQFDSDNIFWFPYISSTLAEYVLMKKSPYLLIWLHKHAICLDEITSDDLVQFETDSVFYYPRVSCFSRLLKTTKMGRKLQNVLSF